ncbi:MAG: glycoside hydrolase domain-containing protein, partial [Acidimicrobiales bacterium]
ATLTRLDTFFSAALNQPGNTVVPETQAAASGFGIYYAGNQYTPANEPDLWAPWYYDWLGQPWKTQQVVRAEMSSYNDTPFFGLPGDDDTGELSAWYVLAALGMYRVTPGVPAWELNSPAFPSVAIRLPAAGGVLREEAPGASTATVYVHALTLDGRPVKRTYLTSCELTANATLHFTLGVTPDRSWAAGPSAAPPSLSNPTTPSAVSGCLEQMAP